VTVNCSYQNVLSLCGTTKGTLRMWRRLDALRAVMLWLVNEQRYVMGLHLFRWERGKVGRDVC
jgi:hypothetical protein